MRPVLYGDISAVARALLCHPARGRVSLFDRMIVEAEAADKYRKRYGRAHVNWGNGSLMAVANTRPQADEPYLDCPEYCCVMALVFCGLLAWRRGQMARGGRIQEQNI